MQETGLSTIAVLALIGGALVAVGFAAALVVLTLRKREAGKPDIPVGMRPGPADDVLERRMMERFLGWAVVFVIFFAAWLPILWLREPDTNVADAVTLTESSVRRGASWFGISDESNPTGFGCARCHGPAGAGGQTIPFMGTGVQPPPLDDVCGGTETGHPLIESLEDIRTTIEQGREGTAMPSWSVRYAGPMNDQQIDDLINYLISIQQDVPDDQNLCRGATTDEGTDEGATGGGDEG